MKEIGKGFADKMATLARKRIEVDFLRDEQDGIRSFRLPGSDDARAEKALFLQELESVFGKDRTALMDGFLLGRYAFGGYGHIELQIRFEENESGELEWIVEDYDAETKRLTGSSTGKGFNAFVENFGPILDLDDKP